MRCLTRTTFIVTIVAPVIACADPWTTRSQPDLATNIAAAAPLDVEAVCQPTHTVRNERPVIVPNRDGLGVDILVMYYKGYQGPCTLFSVDTQTAKITRSDVPRGRNTHVQGSVLAPNGRWFTTLQRVGGGLELWVYDPDNNQYTARASFGQDLDLFGQSNELATAPDGHLYGTVGSRKSGEAAFYRIDPEEQSVTMIGTGGNLQGAPFSAGIAVSADARIYAVYGKTPYKLIAFDGQRGCILATANPRGHIRILKTGAELAFSILEPNSGVDQSGTYIVRDVRLTRMKEDASSSTIQEAMRKKGEQPGQDNATDRKATDPQSGAQAIAPALDGKQPKLPLKSVGLQRHPHPRVEIDSSRLDPSMNTDGRGLLRYRSEPQAEWIEARLDPPTYPEAIIQLVTLPDGRIFGTATNRAGHFVYDPKTNTGTFLGRTGLQHQSSTVSGNSIFMSGYPSSIVWEYDFKRPWQELNGNLKTMTVQPESPNTNPRLIGSLRDHSGVHMATCAATDSRGCVYFAGRWYRDGKGGGVGWWDPETQTAGGFWKELSNLQVIDCVSVTDGRYLVLSTLIVPDQVLNKEHPESAQLCVIDTHADKNHVVKRIEPVAGGRSTGLIAWAGGSRIIGVAPSTQGDHVWLLYGVDLQTDEVAFAKQIPGLPEGKMTSIDLLHTYRSNLTRAPDGSIWLSHLGALLRIHPSDAHVTVVGRPILTDEATAGFESLSREERMSLEQLGLVKRDGAPAGIARLTFSGNDLYLGGTPTLRRIRDILGLQ